MPIAHSEVREVATTHQRPITGKRLGDKGLVAALLLRQGCTFRETARLTGLSTRTVNAIKNHNIVDQRLIEAIDQTYIARVKLRGHAALSELEDPKTLRNPSRTSVLWKVVREAREMAQQEQGSKTQDIADIMEQLGFKLSASISRIDVQITQAPANACLPVEANEANTEESST